MLLLAKVESDYLNNIIYINPENYKVSNTPNKETLPFGLKGGVKIKKFYITLNEQGKHLFYGRAVGGLFITEVYPGKNAWVSGKVHFIHYSAKQLGVLSTPEIIYYRLINYILTNDQLHLHRYYSFKNIQSIYTVEERKLLMNYNQSLSLTGAFNLETPTYTVYNKKERLVIPIDGNFRANLFIAKNKLR